MEGISEKQSKVWICSRCKSVFSTRWLLARHLKQVHDIKAKNASDEALMSEWWRVYNTELSKIRSQKNVQ